MKDFLQDLISHTHSLGNGILPILRVNSNESKTFIDAVSVDRQLLFTGTTKEPIENFNGVFGMSNLNKLDLHLKCPEYENNANISITYDVRNDETVPTGLHFQNEFNDYQNDFVFLHKQIVDMKFKDASYLGTTWDVDFEPSQVNINRLKFQASANSEESFFTTKTDSNKNLLITFGDNNRNSGSFVFCNNISGILKKEWQWPTWTVVSVLNLTGNKTVKINDHGALQITVDSGLAIYDYTFKGKV